MDIVIPNNNEKEFVSIAKKLNYKKLVFLYDTETENKIKDTNIEIETGLLVTQKNLNKRIKVEFTASKGSKYNREIIEKLKPSIIFEIESENGRDFIHHRRSGLNQVLCKLMQQNKIAYGISISSILNSKNKAVTLGRIAQNIRLCRKYKIEIITASFAQNPFEMRSKHDIESLFKMINA